ncbi:uncharacterized protein LOC110976568 isoform X2 [Acanthaster planci]|uniref:Uncharacterized protein LOC110976568 isoform X2 n=1 Tax=Acanthaster planci TaxID=133434 RepID=A0A8B7XXM6_ACAPL|nr:uncharacterized protein LOC110976568 isoform X2 [Acanthaster planci]
MAETDGTAQPTFQISLAQDVEPIPPSTSGDLKAEGAVIVQGIISGEQFVSPELAMQISQAGGQVAAAESMTSSSAPVVVQSSVMGTGQTTDGEPAYGAEQIGMHEVAAVVESLPGVVSQHVMVDMSRTAPEGQDVPIDGNFQQGHVISQTTPDGGVEVDGVPDQMQTSSASDGHDVIIEVHQVPDHDLLLSMADANPESERAEAENADATVETGREPLKDAIAEVESIPSDDAPQPKEGQGEKEASKEAKEVIFVCIHGQSFRCRPQAGIPVDDEVKESPVETCACSKIKKSPTVVKRPSRMAVVKGGKLARKLRNRQQLFTCDTCGGRFSNKEALDLHMVAHGDDDNEDSEDEEDKADEETTQQRTKVVTMQGRAQRRKPTQEEKACPDCGKVFSRLSALGAHKRQHKKEN